MTKTFYLSEDHIKLLRAMYVYWNDQGYLGAPIVDVKRPYGNKDVIRSVAEIIGAEPALVKKDEGPVFTDDQEEHFLNLHEDTAIALQIVLCVGEFKPGLYKLREGYDTRSWYYAGEL